MRTPEKTGTKVITRLLREGELQRVIRKKEKKIMEVFLLEKTILASQTFSYSGKGEPGRTSEGYGDITGISKAKKKRESPT